MSPMLFLVSLLACTNGDPIEDSGSVEAPFTSTLPVSTCGLEPYTWIDDSRLGEIVEVEKLDEASMSAELIDGLLALSGVTVLSPVPFGIETWRFRYITQDKGELIEATGVINLPATDEEQTFEVVAWLHPTMGFNDTCAPSAGPLENWLASGLLATQGYAVVAPDYLGMAGWGEPSGMLHPYVVPEPTAVASLDAIRALKRFQADGHVVGTDAIIGDRIALWGASEGGFAALWSDRYSSGYAPELEITSVVAAVPPTSFTGIAVDAVSSEIAATEGLVGVLTGSWAWHNKPASLEDFLTDEEPSFIASRVEDVLLTECNPGGLFDDVEGVEDVFQADFISSVKAEDWDALGAYGCMLQEGNLRSSSIPRGSDAPVFIVSGEHDDLVVGARVRADIPGLCEQGYNIDYVECEEAGHVDAAANTLLRQIDWVKARFDGEALEGTCVVGAPEVCESPL